MPIKTDIDIPGRGRKRKGIRIATALAVPLLLINLTADHSGGNSSAAKNPSGSTCSTGEHPSAAPSIPKAPEAFFVPTTETPPGPLRVDATPVSYCEVSTQAILVNPAQFKGKKVCFPAVGYDALLPVPDGKDAFGELEYGNTQVQLPGGTARGFFMELNPLLSPTQPDPRHMIGAFIPDTPYPYTIYAEDEAFDNILDTKPNLTLCGRLTTEPETSTLGRTLRQGGNPNAFLFKADGVVVHTLFNPNPTIASL